MSASSDLRVLVTLDRFTPLECLTLAATEAHLRSAELVVAIADPKGDRMVSAFQAANPGVRFTIDHSGVAADRDVALTVAGGRRSLDIAMVASAPVLVVPTVGCPAGHADSPVVVDLNHEPTNAMLEFAFAEAAARSATVLGLYVPARLGEAPDPAVERSLAETLDRWSEKYHGVPTELRTIAGLDAAVVLAVASRSAQLVVIGQPDSVVRVMVGRAGCPVAVVPANDQV